MLVGKREEGRGVVIDEGGEADEGNEAGGMVVVECKGDGCRVWPFMSARERASALY